MVKPGYKQTEIGIIPEEWEVNPLKKVAPLQRGFDLPYSNMEEGIYPVVFSNGIGAFHNSYMVKGPGVVTGRSGTIGNVHFVDTDFWPHNTSLWVTNFFGNDPKFVYYLLKSIRWEQYNSGSGVPTLNRNDIHDLLLRIPTKEEQTIIAEQLSDIDSLISVLDKLILKKKAIKQGAMQELLTGKKRLPGFENEWEEICLADVCTFYGGGTPDKKKTNWWNGNIPWISSSDLQENDITNINIDRFITHEALEKSATQLCPLNSVLVVTRVGVGKVAVTPCSICTSQDFTSIVSRVHNSYFLAYALQPIMKRLAEQSQGTSIKGVTSDDIKQIVIRTPNKEEQKAIAETLFYMDEEIRLLEKKLGKCRQIKQGMMQQLLTGKIRLV